MAHIYSGILVSDKKKRNCFTLVRRMDIESVIQSEVSQKEKNKYCVLTPIYES